MAPPRKRKVTARRAVKRDYAAEYARRQARARTAGFENYYDKRVRGGELDAPRAEGAELRRRRGHAGAEDLIAYIEPGDTVLLVHVIGPHYERNARDEWKRIDKIVHPDDPRREERRFTLRNFSDAELARLIERELEAGANMTLIPSLDQQRLVRKEPPPARRKRRRK